MFNEVWKFNDVNKQQVWWEMHKSLMPPNHRCIKNKWVFKIRHNNMYQVQLAVCGYSQVPSIDFSENYLPLVNDITFHIILLMVIYFGYSAKIVDWRLIFYGECKEKIYMEWPKVCLAEKDEYIILNKCINGLVQVVRQYQEKAIKILKKLGFVGGNVDPCLNAKKSVKGLVYIALYVDDNLMVGNIEAIDNEIAALKENELVLKIV